jgi:hypothetical protein
VRAKPRTTPARSTVSLLVAQKSITRIDGCWVCAGRRTTEKSTPTASSEGPSVAVEMRAKIAFQCSWRSHGLRYRASQCAEKRDVGLGSLPRSAHEITTVALPPLTDTPTIRPRRSKSAIAALSHATPAPPRPAMNSRRLIGPPQSHRNVDRISHADCHVLTTCCIAMGACRRGQ